MTKIFDYGSHPGRKDTTEPTANTIISVPSPAFRADANDVLRLIHKIVQDKKNKLRDQRLDGGPSTLVTVTPSTNDSDDTDNNAVCKPASRGTTDSARSLRPGSKPEPVILKLFLEKVLAKQKAKRQIVQLPKGLSPSSQFPELLHESVEDRMNSCREYLKLLNEMDRENIICRAKNIRRWIKEIRHPVVEQRAFDWEMARLEREYQRAQIKENSGDALAIVGKGIVKSAAKQVVGSGIVDLATKAMRAVKAKPLRSIAPLKIASGHPRKSKQQQGSPGDAMTAGLKSTPSSGSSIIGPDTPRTQIGQIRQVPKGSVLKKNLHGGSSWVLKA